MTLPDTLTLIRHGYSEANRVVEGARQKTLAELPEGLYNRHDAHMRLTPRGVEQAQAAGAWLRANATFDRFYVSPHVRAKETAAHLSLGGSWRVEDRIRERDWGEIHYVNPDMSDPLSDESRHNRDLFQWYWEPRAGESLATGVRLRVESMMNSMYRKTGVHHPVMVTHEEFLKAARFVIERMEPDVWEEQDKDPAYKVQNAMIIQYSRVNPFNPTEAMRSEYRWRRAICPWDESLSWDGGAWVALEHHKYSDADLFESVEDFDPLFR